jgi:hypothetical protein
MNHDTLAQFVNALFTYSFLHCLLFRLPVLHLEVGVTSVTVIDLLQHFFSA